MRISHFELVVTWLSNQFRCRGFVVCVTALIQIRSLGQGRQVSDVRGDYRANGGREDGDAGGGRKGHGISRRWRRKIACAVPNSNNR